MNNTIGERANTTLLFQKVRRISKYEVLQDESDND